MSEQPGQSLRDVGRGAEIPMPGVFEKLSPGDQEYENFFSPRTFYDEVNLHNLRSCLEGCNGVHLYEIELGGRKETGSILWVWRNPCDKIRGFHAIPGDQKEKFSAHPEAIEDVNQILLECYKRAVDFYAWKETLPRGFIIEDAKNRYGFTISAGRWGIGINFGTEIFPLFEALQSDDSKQIALIREHLAASMVHELVHNERDEVISMIALASIEIASHIAQFLFSPKDNKMFIDQLLRTYDRIATGKEWFGKKDVRHIYDRAQYSAMLIVASYLAEHSEEFKKVFEGDSDSHKLGALRKIGEYLDDDNLEYLRHYVLPEIMGIDGRELLEKANNIEQRLGITESIAEET